MKRARIPMLFSCVTGLACWLAPVCPAAEAPLPAPASFREAFQSYFLIGAALNEAQFTEQNTREAALVKRQFNSITPENVLKWERVHPKPEAFNFGPADRYVAFGETNGMFIVGHTLVWHSQTPDWVFHHPDGSRLTRDQLLARMHEHIAQVVGRYKGRIKGWDVVNEALNEDGTLRSSEWLKIIGPDYVQKAFEFAHAADPKAELYYNDFSLENEPKRLGACRLLKQLQAAGVHLTGVGLQNHDKLDWPSAKQLGATIDCFAQLGLRVMITELDVDVLPAATRRPTADLAAKVTASGEADPYRNGLPEAMQQALAKRYGELFATFVKHRHQIERVTFWGVTDADSWLNYWPVRGRTNYPLPFDREGRNKAAFDAILKTAGQDRAQAGHTTGNP